MKFALQDSLLQLGDNYNEVFQTACEMGYKGVEITYFGKPLDDAISADIRAASERSGIPVSAVCGGYAHWIGHFDQEKRIHAAADIAISLRHISAMNGGGLIAPAAYGMFTANLPPYSAPRDAAGDEAALLDSLWRIAEAAEKYEVNFYLEPLNRYEDHMINTVERAVSLAEAVGSKRIRVMADTYHMNIEEKDPLITIEAHLSAIGYYHLSDSNRHLPGHGHIDFGAVLSKLRTLDYDGFLSLECRIGSERRAELEDTLSFLRRC